MWLAYIVRGALKKNTLICVIERNVKFVTIWYGIVEENHSKEVFRWLVIHRNGCQINLWFVTVIDGKDSVSRYKQLSRFHNHRR